MNGHLRESLRTDSENFCHIMRKYGIIQLSYLKAVIKRNMSMTEKIKILLIKRGMTQKELAEKLNVSQPVLSKKYKLDNWREDDLKQIAEILQADFEGTFILKDTKERI